MSLVKRGFLNQQQGKQLSSLSYSNMRTQCMQYEYERMQVFSNNMSQKDQDYIYQEEDSINTPTDNQILGRLSSIYPQSLKNKNCPTLKLNKNLRMTQSQNFEEQKQVGLSKKNQLWQQKEQQKDQKVQSIFNQGSYFNKLPNLNQLEQEQLNNNIYKNKSEREKLLEQRKKILRFKFDESDINSFSPDKITQNQGKDYQSKVLSSYDSNPFQLKTTKSSQFGNQEIPIHSKTQKQSELKQSSSEDFTRFFSNQTQELKKIPFKEKRKIILEKIEIEAPQFNLTPGMSISKQLENLNSQRDSINKKINPYSSTQSEASPILSSQFSPISLPVLEQNNFIYSSRNEIQRTNKKRNTKVNSLRFEVKQSQDQELSDRKKEEVKSSLTPKVEILRTGESQTLKNKNIQRRKTMRGKKIKLQQEALEIEEEKVS